jgi:DnaJ-class molecular chaperone
MTNYYERLGVPFDASPMSIRRAFHRLALLYHPDKTHTSTTQPHFLQIQEAYRVLSQAELRSQYNESLLSSVPRNTKDDGPHSFIVIPHEFFTQVQIQDILASMQKKPRPSSSNSPILSSWWNSVCDWMKRKGKENLVT